MKLYEISAEIRELAEMLEESGVDQQTMLDTISGSTAMMAFEEKVAGCAALAKEMTADAKAIKSEIDRLTAMYKAKENQLDWLKQYMKGCMESAGIDKIKVGVHSVRIQKNSVGSVLVDDEKAVPAAYLTLVPEHTEVNKQALADELKAGKKIPGVRYEVGNHLRVG